MGFWYYFWTANFLGAGSAFTLITLVVLVRGGKDLRDMLVRLKTSGVPTEPTSPTGTAKQRPS
jgi:hypothetical protein